MTKPSELYVGVIDLFAILLPGAIATAIFVPTTIGTHVVGLLAIDPANNPGKWVAFLTCSYFLGHLIFLAGSYIDPLCEARRKRRERLGRERLERRKPGKWETLVAPEIEDERAYRCATGIRDSLLDIDERAALNTFQWSRSVLIAECPSAAEDIHRLEADSKFFRSFLVVCALSPIVFFLNWSLGSRAPGSLSSMALEIGVALLLVQPCFARYYGRRLKGRTQAYIHVVTLYRLGHLSKPQCEPEPALQSIDRSSARDGGVLGSEENV